VIHLIGLLHPGRRLADAQAAGIVITLNWE
jgi:hypothetical protein